MRASTFVRRVGRLLLLAVLGLVCASCGSNGPKLHPVRGKVLFEGQPTEGATVVLRPISAKTPEGVFPYGVVKADGTYTLECYKLGQGAPEGDYVAVVTWNARGSNDVASRLPERYAQEETSGLAVSVKPGKNELNPFQLTR